MPAAERQIYLWGAGGHAKVVADVASELGVRVAGFIEEAVERHGQDYYGAKILGGESWLLSSQADRTCEVFVAIGHNAARLRCIEIAIRAGYTVPSLIHPAASVSPTARLESGTIVMAGAIVQADTVIGIGGIINTGASVDHDGVLGRGVHIAPGARLAGQVTVGDRTLIGVGAVVIPQICIGRDCVAGAGAAVVSDVLDGQTVAGVPARVLKRSVAHGNR
ncbi:MAG: acetyltransferase [Planctomycetaceae bacterium]